MTTELNLLKRSLDALQGSGDRYAYLKEDIEQYLARQDIIAQEGSPCCHAPVIHYRSTNKKVCADCNQNFDWPLKEGQPPLIKATR